MLALCIPLQVLAYKKSLPGQIGNKNTNTANEQLTAADEVGKDLSESDGGSGMTGDEHHSAGGNASSMSEQIEAQAQAVIDIYAQDNKSQQKIDAGGGVQIEGEGTDSNAVAGFEGGTVGNQAVAYRMSLAKLDNAGFAIYGNADALENAVQEYCSKHYVACEEGAYYYPGNKGTTTTNRGKTAVTAPSGSVAEQLMKELYTGKSGDVTGLRDSGSMYIALSEDQLNQLMQELSSIDAYNNALYQEWKKGSSSHPIVAVIEVAGRSVNGRNAKDAKGYAWVSVADCAYEIGGASAYEAFLARDLTNDAGVQLGSAGKDKTGFLRSGLREAAQSDVGLAAVTNMAAAIQGSHRDEHDWWPYFYTKHMFATWWPRGTVSDSTLPDEKPGKNALAWSLWAYQLKQPRSTSIVGCTTFSLRGGVSGKPSGVFDWHIDAEGLPLNASGHAEDKAVDDTGGSTYKQCLVGSVNLYNKNWNEWEWYLSENNVNQVTLNISVYNTGMDTFSLSYGKVLNRHDGPVKAERTNYQIPLDKTTFVNYLKTNASSIDLVSRDRLGPKVDDYLSVSYAMTISVKLDSTGEEILLTNEDVHWAVYGTDEGRTFKFQQEIGNAYAQIKQGELDKVFFEAMAGTPTTEDLFISMGGEQYVVNMQYRYVEDDYVRTYMMETVPVKNFTYYKLGDKLQTQLYSSSGEEEKFNDDPDGGMDMDAARDAYETAAKKNLKDATDEIKGLLKGMVQDTNKDVYGSMYDVCEGPGFVPKAFTDFLDNIQWETASSSESAEVVLFKGTDPDTGENFQISARLRLVAENGFYPFSGEQSAYTEWHANEPDITDVELHRNWENSRPLQYQHSYKWDASYQYVIEILFSGDSELSRECLTAPKELKNLVELKQQFNKVKYMDILDCAVWQLKEGAEIGAGAILCSPHDGANKIIEEAVNQLGYVYYDSEQKDSRSWDESTRTWRAVNANDLEETGRLVNTFNEAHKERLESIPGAYRIEELGDTIRFKYDPSSQGGRSHRSFYKFLAQAAALTFYENENTPYANYILCSSDIMALHTGEPDGGDQRWLPFVGFQFDSRDYKDAPSLFQYILSKGSPVSKYFAAGYEIDGKNPNASAGTAWATPIFDENSLYLGGVVELNNDHGYLEYTRESLCVYASAPGAYSFVNNISESGQMPRVGYRGDWNTESDAHKAILLAYGSSFKPGEWFCFNGEMNKLRAGVSDLAQGRKITLEDSLSRSASADKEFPYIKGLNVVRDTPNNQYAMGEAALFYDNIIYMAIGKIDGVITSIIHTNYSNVKNSTLRGKTPTQGISLQANYDDAWKSINDIVIFNPSSAQYAQVLSVSKYMPDAQNSGETDYVTNPLRDQRTDMTFTDNDYNESVMRPSSDKEGDLSVNKSIVSTSYKLKERSEIPTSFYEYPVDYIINDDNSTEHYNYDYSESVETEITTRVAGTYTFSMGGGYSYMISLDETDEVYVKRDENAVYMRGRDADLTFQEFVDDIGVQHAQNPDYLARIGYSPGMSVIPMSKGETIGIQIVDDSGVAIPKFLKGEIIHLSFKFASAFNEGDSPFLVYVDGVDENTSDMNAQTSATAVKTFKWSENGTRLDYYIDMPNDSTSGVLTLVADSNLSILRSDIPLIEFDDILLFRVADGQAQLNAEPHPCNTLSYLYNSNSSSHVTRNVTCYNNLIVSYTKTEGGTEVFGRGKSIQVDVRLNARSYSLRPEALADPHKVENRNWRYYVLGWNTTSGITIDSPDHPLLYVDGTQLYWPGTNEVVTVATLMDEACLVKLNGRLYVTTTELGKKHMIPGATSSVTSWDTFNLFSEIDFMIDVTNNPDQYPLHDIGRTSANEGERAGYEFFFKLSNGDGPLYDVQWATNLAYRWQWKEVEFNVDGTKKDADWLKDWEIIESTQSEVVTKEVKNGGIKDFLSLDDEFTIYYPNTGDFAGNGAKDIGNVQNILGYGWKNEMDTSKWIYQKWVTFDMDVFMFHPTDPSVEYNPNNLDNLTFYPAGYIIPLGNYTGDSGPADNDGHWDDYGEDNGYMYHFWVALSNGEQREAETDMATLNINSTGNGANTGNTTPLNKEVPSPPLRYANARKIWLTDIVGRIGGLTMVDSADYRWSNTFKTVREDAPWLVYGLLKKLDPYSNEHGTHSTQKTVITDVYDVRGRIGVERFADKLYGDKDYKIYTKAESMNTYGTQWHKDFTSAGVRVEQLPLKAEYNNNNALKLTQQKLGYKSLMSLETIGNYYGSAADESSEGGAKPVNENGEYGDRKVQVRPVYLAVKVNPDDNSTEIYPVDVYMTQDGSYTKINSGSTDVIDTITTLSNNTYYVTMDTNDGTYDEPSQVIKRRMTTPDEIAITKRLFDAVKGNTSSKSFITPQEVSHGITSMSTAYTYGNGQYMFLRERLRTFVGKSSQALGYKDMAAMDGYDNAKLRYNLNAQKYYFDVGLPSSAVFVKAGTKYKDILNEIIKDDNVYILVTLDIYVRGDIWMLQYKSPISNMDISFQTDSGEVIIDKEWKGEYDANSWLIPVSIIDIDDGGSRDDLGVSGTH